MRPYHSGKSIKFQLTIDWFPANMKFAESLSFFFLIVLRFCQWSWLCQEMYGTFDIEFGMLLMPNMMRKNYWVIYIFKYYRYFINPCVFLMLNELLSVLMQMGNVFILTHLRIHVLLKEWFSRMCVKSIKSISLHILLFAWLFICI